MRNLLKNNPLFLLLVLSFCARFTLAQNWQTVGNGLSLYATEINYDTTTNSLLIAGAFLYADTLSCYGLVNWDGNNYHNYTAPINNCSTNCGNPAKLISYNNRLFMTGYYGPSYSNGNTEQLFEYINNKWEVMCPIGNKGFVQNYNIINGKLFAFGMFIDSICGKNPKSVAVLNGSTWDVFHEGIPNYWIFSGEYYKGEYYFGGNFNDANGFNEIIRWDGNQWRDLATGIHGGMAMLSKLKVYKDILYVGGYYYKSDGNAADCLMAWDGKKWFDPFPQINFIDFVQDLEVINDELYISGNYIIPSSNDSNMYVLARYNGCDLKAFGGKYKFPDYDKAPNCIAHLNNRIYLAVNDSFMHKSAKYLVSADIDSIKDDVILNVNNCSINKNTIGIYPNPTNSILNIYDNEFNTTTATITITNPLGQVVLSLPFSNQLDVFALAQGLYYLTLQNEESKKTVKLIKN